MPVKQVTTSLEISVNGELTAVITKIVTNLWIKSSLYSFNSALQLRRRTILSFESAADVLLVISSESDEAD